MLLPHLLRKALPVLRGRHLSHSWESIYTVAFPFCYFYSCVCAKLKQIGHMVCERQVKRQCSEKLADRLLAGARRSQRWIRPTSTILLIAHRPARHLVAPMPSPVKVEQSQRNNCSCRFRRAEASYRLCAVEAFSLIILHV